MDVAEEERWELLLVRKSAVSSASKEQVDELRLLDASVGDILRDFSDSFFFFLVDGWIETIVQMRRC